MGGAASSQSYTRPELTAFISTAYADDAESLSISEVSQRLNEKARAAAAPADEDLGGAADEENGWKSAVLDAPPTRDERAVALRQIFDSLDEEGDHSITKAEYVTTMSARGMPFKDAVASFNAMDDMRSGRLTVAKFDHYVMKQTLELVSNAFKEMDMADGERERQLSPADVKRFLMKQGLSKDQAIAAWHEIDANKNKKVNFREWKHWASGKLTKLAIDEEQAKAAGA